MLIPLKVRRTGGIVVQWGSVVCTLVTLVFTRSLWSHSHVPLLVKDDAFAIAGKGDNEEVLRRKSVWHAPYEMHASLQQRLHLDESRVFVVAAVSRMGVRLCSEDEGATLVLTAAS